MVPQTTVASRDLVVLGTFLLVQVEVVTCVPVLDPQVVPDFATIVPHEASQ
jgi:hypothetical protein